MSYSKSREFLLLLSPHHTYNILRKKQYLEELLSKFPGNQTTGCPDSFSHLLLEQGMTTPGDSVEESQQLAPMSPTMSEASSQQVDPLATLQELSEMSSNSSRIGRGGRATQQAALTKPFRPPYPAGSYSTTSKAPGVTGKRLFNGSRAPPPSPLTRTTSVADLAVVSARRGRALGSTRGASRAALSSTVSKDDMEEGELSDGSEPESDDESFEEFEVAIDEDCSCEACRWNYSKSLEYQELDQ